MYGTNYIYLSHDTKINQPLLFTTLQNTGKGSKSGEFEECRMILHFPTKTKSESPPKKIPMKELRSWLSALLRISNLLLTIYTVLITCYNYEM